MRYRICSFLQEEDGAVTVDWVVLTAALVGISLSVYLAIDDGVRLNSEKIRSELVTVAETDFSVTISSGAGDEEGEEEGVIE